MHPPLYESLSRTPKTWPVTGVAGFIGSNLLEALLKLDQTVVGLDNFATGPTSPKPGKRCGRKAGTRARGHEEMKLPDDRHHDRGMADPSKAPSLADRAYTLDNAGDIFWVAPALRLAQRHPQAMQRKKQEQKQEQQPRSQSLRQER